MLIQHHRKAVGTRSRTEPVARPIDQNVRDHLCRSGPFKEALVGVTVFGDEGDALSDRRGWRSPDSSSMHTIVVCESGLFRYMDFSTRGGSHISNDTLPICHNRFQTTKEGSKPT